MAPRPSAAQHGFRSVLAATLLLGFIPLAAGCSSVDTITRETERFTKKTVKKFKRIGNIRFTDKGMKRKTVIVAMSDRTDFAPKDFGQSFQTNVVGYLKDKCAGNLFVPPGDPAFPAQLTTLPREATGRVDNFQLAEIGRSLGVNAILTGTVIDIQQVAEERGIIWWRDIHNYLRVLVNIEAWDMVTASKLVDESYMYETEIPFVDPEDLEQATSAPQELLPLVDAAIQDAAEFLGEDICAAVRDQPWTGFVTAVSGGMVEISAGSEAGLTQGRVLEVFDRGKVVVGAYGERFFKPGTKIGEIKVTAVQPNRATAALEPGMAVEPGSTVRPK